MPNRFKDMYAEEVLCDFLDTCYYGKILNDRFEFTRSTDEENQKEGIDVIITDKRTGKEYLIDEKAQLHYLANGPLPTFSFELQFYSQNETNRRYDVLRTGWLINESLKTTDYILVWPRSKKRILPDQLDTITVDDFDIIELMRINKSKLLNRIYQDTHLDSQALLSAAKTFRKESNSYSNKGVIRKEIIVNGKEVEGMYFTYSTSYREKPINLIIRKEVLSEIAETHHFVSSENVWVPFDTTK